jgi:hypothetical protein
MPGLAVANGLIEATGDVADAVVAGAAVVAVVSEAAVAVGAVVVVEPEPLEFVTTSSGPPMLRTRQPSA